MNETLGSDNQDKQQRLNRGNDRFVEFDSGRSFLNDLDGAVINLHKRFPQASFVVEDRYGVTVRTVTGGHPTGTSRNEWNSIPLALNGRTFGTIRYCGSLGGLSASDITPIVLSLTELEKWVQTEGERRGEKLQKVLSEGVTPEVVRLLSLCGLNEHQGYTLVAMELTSQTNKYLYMDLLRRFMLARIWGYRAALDFVAYRPGGLLAIFPTCNETLWTEKLEGWIEQWNQFQSRLELAPEMDMRAWVTTVDTLYRLDIALREIEATMQFAVRWNLTGLIHPPANYSLFHILARLPQHSIAEFIHRTLGPILEPTHLDLLHTLRIYLSLDQNASKTAKTLYIHRNTLLYRIRHIEELLGIRLRNTQQLCIVWTALEGLELLESCTNVSFGDVSASGSRRSFLISSPNDYI